MLGACVDPEPYPYIERDVARGPRVAELTIDAGGEVTPEPGQGILSRLSNAGTLGDWAGRELKVCGRLPNMAVAVATHSPS